MEAGEEGVEEGGDGGGWGEVEVECFLEGEAGLDEVGSGRLQRGGWICGVVLPGVDDGGREEGLFFGDEVIGCGGEFIESEATGVELAERGFLVGLEIVEGLEEGVELLLLGGGESGRGRGVEPVLSGPFKVGTGVELIGLGEEEGEWKREGACAGLADNLLACCLAEAGSGANTQDHPGYDIGDHRGMEV
jgi:hypothetical protein